MAAYEGIKESRGIEASDTNASSRQVETANEAMDDCLLNLSQFMTKPYSPEKIVFCIDTVFSTVADNDFSFIRQLNSLISNYLEIKRRITGKDVNYGILLLGNEAVNYYEITSKKEMNNVLVALSKMEDEDITKFDFKYMFEALATNLKLPDPTFYSGNKAPPHVYHLILLFARSRYMPCISDSNAYYFVMSNPFVHLDIMYFYNDSSRKQITNALQGIIPKEKGFFYECAFREFALQQAKFMHFLGHPLFRSPQALAKFQIRNIN